jgi:acyl carrier protein
MQRSDLKREIKQLLVAELNLTGRDPSSIDDEAPLFGTGGLGLDSLDALQIAMLVEEKFGVRVPEGDEARPIFRCVSSLSEFIGQAVAQRDAKSGDAPTG